MIGFDLEEFIYRKLKFTVWSFAGETRVRNMWNYSYEGGHAIVYVLDSSNQARIQFAKVTLDSALNHQLMANVPLLVFANKMDIATLSLKDIQDKLGLKELQREWHVQPCCATNGDGLV